MGGSLPGKADTLSHCFHVPAQVRVGEGDMTEGDRALHFNLPSTLTLASVTLKAGTLVNDAGVNLQQLAGCNEGPHLGLLDEQARNGIR